MRLKKELKSYMVWLIVKKEGEGWFREKIYVMGNVGWVE